jgi:hypothetical protein
MKTQRYRDKGDLMKTQRYRDKGDLMKTQRYRDKGVRTSGCVSGAPLA